MKKLSLIVICAAALLSFVTARAQQRSTAKNIVIFLMDGYRWRDLYQGADSDLLFTHKYNHIDSAWNVGKYWSPDQDVRRRKLMPFVWETIAKNGELLGNRTYGNNVNVQNKYRFS